MESTPTNKRYSGRVFDAAALDQVRGILRAHAGASRQQLSYRVCEALDWRKADGRLKDMSCRVALLRLYSEGLIEVTAPRRHFEPKRSYARRTPQGEPDAPIEAPLSALGTVRLEPVERRCSGLWNELIDRYHYLSYKPLPGAQLRYFAYASERLVAVLGLGAANTPKHHGERVVDLNCLVHARRQFVDVKDFFPSQCDHVPTAIATAYHQETQCTKIALNPAQRLAYHQAHSAPAMDALKGWMQQHFADKQVEPNSRRSGI